MGKNTDSSNANIMADPITLSGASFFIAKNLVIGAIGAVGAAILINIF